MNGMSFETSLYTRLKFIPPTRKVFAASEYSIEICCASNNRAYNDINKKYRIKHALSRQLFSSKKSTGISNEIRWIVFKKLTLEVLCDITKNPKELNMCLRELEIHRRVLNAQRVLFSVVLAFYRAKPWKLKVSGIYQDRHGRRARTIRLQHWVCKIV